MTSTYDSTGIVLDRYADILDRLVTLAEAQWGSSVDTSEDEFLGHQIRNMALLLSEINDILQSVYDTMSVANSTGSRLDNLCALIGLERSAADYSTVTLTLTATAATTVPAGTQYKTAAGVVFATDEELVFSGAGSDTVAATCTVTGPYNAAIGEVTTIVNPIYGISACTNAAAATPGKDRDTDAELKIKHTSAVARSGEETAAAIRFAVEEVDGVDDCYVFDNDTNDTASDGTPAHSIHVAVIGGAHDDIAEAIALSKSAGVATYSATTHSADFYDSDTGQNKTIYFDVAADVPLYVAVIGTKIPGLWPDNGETLMKEYLVEHLADFHIADDLSYKSLYKPIYTVPGFICTSLKVDTHSTPDGEADLTATTLERFTLDSADISITVS